MIEDVTRHKNTVFTKDEKHVDRVLRSSFFSDLEESRKFKVEINRYFAGGNAVYQLAKLRMLEFYYEFVDKYIDRRHFELVQMDTDSLYMGISEERLEEVVKPELREQFQAEKNKWLAWDKWSSRTPGLFKLEFERTRMIALCSKCYYGDNDG